jgi:hypothetical protein
MKVQIFQMDTFRFYHLHFVKNIVFWHSLMESTKKDALQISIFSFQKTTYAERTVDK